MNPNMVLSSTEHIRHLERIIEINRTLCAYHNLEQFLHSLIASASELTGCETASILEPDEKVGQLRFLALPWFYREVHKSIKVPLQNSLAGWVFEHGQPAVVQNVAGDPRHFKGVGPASKFTARSLMAVPITYQDHKQGALVLEVINKVGDAHYTEEDLTILGALASQAAIALQNIQLTNELRKTSDFIGIASHELRTPLFLILGHATFLREDVESHYQAQLDIIIVRNAIRLKNIIDNIANIDNAQRNTASVRSHSASIKRIVEEVMDSFRLEAQKKHISLRSDAAAGELLVHGDASKISIALSNMVQNDILFTNPDGHVSITANQIPGYVKVSVIDDGIGIPSKDWPHVFERFYQAGSHLTRKHGGMGLGLSVAKVMIEMHGRRIWAESVEDKGSNFTFILPLASAQADAAGHVPVSQSLWNLHSLS